MNLDFQAGKTPLQSRQNPVIYAALLIALIVLALFFIVWLYLKWKKKMQDTPAYQERLKKRPTKRKDVREAAERYNLSKIEEATLWFLCSRYKIQNIFYSIQEPDTLVQFFDRAYDDLKDSGNHEQINRLFHLRFRLDKIYAGTQNIANTYNLAPSTPLSMYTPEGERVACSVAECTRDFIAVMMPEDYYSSPARRKELSRVAFSFVSKTGMTHAFLTRVMRYQRDREGNPCMLIAHSTELIKKVQRNFKRLELTEPCQFAAVKKEASDNGKVHFIPSDKRNDGILTNISGSGCRLRVRLPLKEGQLICTFFNFCDSDRFIIGKIVKTRRLQKQSLFNIHIHFIDISIEMQNRILAKVYGYIP